MFIKSFQPLVTDPKRDRESIQPNPSKDTRASNEKINSSENFESAENQVSFLLKDQYINIYMNIDFCHSKLSFRSLSRIYFQFADVIKQND